MFLKAEKKQRFQWLLKVKTKEGIDKQKVFVSYGLAVG